MRTSMSLVFFLKVTPCPTHRRVQTVSGLPPTTKIMIYGPGTAHRALREGGGTPSVTRQTSMDFTLEAPIRHMPRESRGTRGTGIITP